MRLVDKIRLAILYLEDRQAIREKRRHVKKYYRDKILRCIMSKTHPFFICPDYELELVKDTLDEMRVDYIYEVRDNGSYIVYLHI